MSVVDFAARVYRDWETFAVPSSGAHDPVKGEIRALFAQIVTLIGSDDIPEQLADDIALLAANYEQISGDVAASTEARNSAEEARDLAQQYAADAAIVSGVNVPIYASISSAAGSSIAAGVKAISTQFRSPSYGQAETLVGGASYSRVSKADIDASGCPASAYFRSTDRFMPDGTTSPTNGGYWLLTESVRTLKMFGAKGGAWRSEDAASIASGQSILTVSGRTSSPEEVGKVVMVKGAGASGALLSTTITGVSGSDYVIASPAGTTVSGARVVLGWDDTVAINDALSMGRAYDEDGDSYLYTDTIWTDVEGGGLIGAGMGKTWLMTLADLDRHIVSVYEAQNVVWSDFSAAGSFSFDDATEYNRLVTMGLQSDLSTSAPAHWNASGCRMERVFATGYTVILHRSKADYSYYGELYGREICGVNVDPGGYGVTSSASHTRDGPLYVVNTQSKCRHGYYHSGDPNDSIAGPIYIDGAALSSYQCRVTEGGGDGCGFVSLHTLNSGDDDTVSEVAAATWTRVDGFVTTTKNPIGGHVIMDNCKGYAFLTDGYPDGDLGTYEVKNHQGWGAGATLKALCRIKPGGDRLTARIIGGELNDSAARGWTVEDSQGVRLDMEIGGTYGRIGNTVDDVSGCDLVAYPRTKPSTALFSFTGVGGANQRIGNLRTITLTDASGLAPSVFGAGLVFLQYSSPALLTGFADMYEGQRVTTVPLNANVTFDQGGGAGQFNMQAVADKTTQTRIPVSFISATGRILQV